MAISAFASGTQTCVITTEHTLASVNVAGVFVFEVDLTNAALGDVFELRVYKITLTGGTARLWSDPVVFAGVQSDPEKSWVPLSNELTDTDSLKFTIKQVAGTGRNVPYKALRHS